jgi:hypothetical protein
LQVYRATVIGGEDDFFVASLGHGSRGSMREVAHRPRMSKIPGIKSFSVEQAACVIDGSGSVPD